MKNYTLLKADGKTKVGIEASSDKQAAARAKAMGATIIHTGSEHGHDKDKPRLKKNAAKDA